VYPDTPATRDRWVLEQRGTRTILDPEIPYDFLVEEEHFATRDVGPVATIFLTNKECPWRCAMCDLWRNTLTHTVPAGAIARQISYALARLPVARQVKLYNSGSFFDPRAVPPEEYAAIAALVSHFERVIVECHPALIGENCFRFHQMLDGKLEIAMGLETAHPLVLEKLNKKMTLSQYAAAAELVLSRGIDLRSFILVQPPFMQPEESIEWASRSIDFAVDCGATAITLIPTRGGTDAMETLAALGEFVPPDLSVLEAAFRYGLGLRRARVFVDLWDIARLTSKACCGAVRIEKLREANLTQQPIAPHPCNVCGSGA